MGNSFGDVEEESNLELSPLYCCEVEQFHVEALVHTKEGGDCRRDAIQCLYTKKKTISQVECNKPDNLSLWLVRLP